MSVQDPFARFGDWLAEAERDEPNDPAAMSVASVGPDGRPSLRMVLLRGYDTRGFVFYTNFESRKGREILAHPFAALCFHWKSLQRQVRIEGPVEVVSEEEADAYFATRPRDSQIGAWASDQSRPLASRFELETRVAKFAAKFAIGSIPRPPHWSGMRVIPERIEFWKSGMFRLHDRLLYERKGEGWETHKLFP
ncbi:MAG: pyridoxamine 5'-phosphate oxidase [Gammaproteobacteria bacterium]|nr:pyridoxamine 5'-phosphate oxidase [Gammaproteobacteria bacterium]